MYWIDKGNIESGDDFAMQIINAIENSSIFLFIVSENSSRSMFSIKELDYAISQKKKIVPFILDISWAQDKLPSSLKFKIYNNNWLDYQDVNKWQKSLLELVNKKNLTNSSVFESLSADVKTWKTTQLGKEEKDVILKICTNRQCAIYIDAKYECDIATKEILNLPMEFGSYILSFEDKDDPNLYKSLAVDIEPGVLYKSLVVELPQKSTQKIYKEEITCFIAGSKRLLAERDKMRAVVANMYVKWKSRNFLIETYSFDNFNHTMSELGHQEEYNQFIKNDSDLVLFLFDDEVGSITKTELEIAIKSFKTNKHPQIIIYSKIKKEESSAIRELRDFLSKEDLYWVDYESLDDLAKKFESDLNDYLFGLFYNNLKKHN